MRVQLDIETHDRRLGFDIAGVGNSLSAGTRVDVPGGAKIVLQGAIVRKGFGIPEVLQFVVDAAVSIEIGLFSAWLYDKVKDRPVERIVINRRVVTEITEHGIRQVLEEEIHSLE